MRHVIRTNKTAILFCAAISAALAANADIFVDASASADGADGVHLSQKGHEYVAQKEFGYLQSSGSR